MGKQQERVEEYLKVHRQINPLQSWSELGIYRLGAVIHEMRKEGWSIVTELKSVPNKFGEKCMFANYVLGEEK